MLGVVSAGLECNGVNVAWKFNPNTIFCAATVSSRPRAEEFHSSYYINDLAGRNPSAPPVEGSRGEARGGDVLISFCLAMQSAPPGVVGGEADKGSSHHLPVHRHRPKRQ